jgi:hypothetical protein
MTNEKKTYYELNKDLILQRAKEYREANKDKILQRKKEYREANKDKIKQYQNTNKDKIVDYQKEYRQMNKDKLSKQSNDYRKERKQTDPAYKLKLLIRANITNSLKKSGFKKLSHTEQILGCTFDEFKIHIENQFNEFMSWDNHGLHNGQLNYGWDIDHKIPLSSAMCEADIIKLNHYTNLQPLCSHINRFIKKDNNTF